MNLMNTKPDRGFYKISIAAASVTNAITVKVLSETVLDYLEIGTGDADQTTQPKLLRYSYNIIPISKIQLYFALCCIFKYNFVHFRVNTESPTGKLEPKIEADSQQKLVMRFLLKDSTSKKPMRVHQAFVRFTSALKSNSKHEIFFVAEPDAAHVYKFDMVILSFLYKVFSFLTISEFY